MSMVKRKMEARDLLGVDRRKEMCSFWVCWLWGSRKTLVLKE